MWHAVRLCTANSESTIGKASRSKSSALDDRTREGLALAGEMVRHPQVLPTFASIARFSDMSKKAGELSMFGQVADAIGKMSSPKPYERPRSAPHEWPNN